MSSMKKSARRTGKTSAKRTAAGRKVLGAKASHAAAAADDVSVARRLRWADMLDDADEDGSDDPGHSDVATFKLGYNPAAVELPRGESTRLGSQLSLFSSHLGLSSRPALEEATLWVSSVAQQTAPNWRLPGTPPTRSSVS